jgi:cyclic beta-1,2-glucan synthetase
MTTTRSDHRTRECSRISRVEGDGLAAQQAQLTNGRYHVTLNSSGSGVSECNGMAVTRRGLDIATDADGFHIYLRDLEDEYLWSAGYQPVRRTPTEYDFRHIGKTAVITRVDREIKSQLTVCVVPDHDVELRRCRLTNLGNGSRRIELTSYVEFVLNTHAADVSHPAFSKIFLETQFLDDSHTILVKRRPRSPDAPKNWGFHRILVENADSNPPTIQFETNRAHFIGRGRSLADPRALNPGEVLSSGRGAVLDPIGSLRTAICCEPGESKEVIFVLGAAQDPDDLDALLLAIGDVAQAAVVLERAASGDESTNGRAGPVEGKSRDNAERIIVHPPHVGDQPNSSNGQELARNRPAWTTSEGQQTLPAEDQETLQFDNGYGGFSGDGREYVIRLRRDGQGRHQYPPQPWCNVIANEQAGFLVSEAGAGYTWAGNSRLNRLTGWHNDPVCDAHAEAMWIRDEDAGIYWSPTPRPTPAAADYTVRHGFGYTSYTCAGHELAHETTMFMAHDAPVKLTRIRLVNRSDRPRRISLFSFLRWVLGELPGETSRSIETRHDAQRSAILAMNSERECYQKHVAFSALVAHSQFDSSQISFTADRRSFLGRFNDLSAPLAVTAGDRLNNRVGEGLDPCAAWQVSVEIPPGGEFEATWMLGEAAEQEQIAEWYNRFDTPVGVQEALDQTIEFWRHTLSAVQIETPLPEIDLLTNGWLVYQNLSCRLWGRSAYYQPGGAFGFRDQLQDAAALVLQRPDLTRKQILRHAAQQFVEGDVLHWWHPDNGFGLRTRFSDDLLWLPYVAASYIQATGDDSLLDERVPFVTERELSADEQEAYLHPNPTGDIGHVYDHCCRALDRGLTVGQHGLPLIGCGDWNDGMNRVGMAGTGESVWLGFFICHILEWMLPICLRRKDRERVDRYTAYRDRLRDVLNTAGWDGGWYRRAYYDNGRPVGSSSSDECQIDVLAQAWAVISHVAPQDRAELAMRAAEERLVDTRAGLIRLMAPPFNRSSDDPGYIKGYLPGIRENGGQYTHGALWFVRALAEMGRGSQAVEMLRMLSPITHTASQQQVETYQTEPYVLAADVYSEPPHEGRGGWTWYTGSAGWMYRVVTESIFGLALERGETLVINPCISASWPCCRLSYRLPDGVTCYHITIENPHGRESGVVRARLDDRDVAVTEGKARIPLQFDNRPHHVTLHL